MQDNRTFDEKYAKESFTWRRMKGWQVWALVAAAVALVVIGLTVRF